jgi:ribosomal protein L1
MDEDVLNIQVRKFLKHVGVTSQREIEGAIRTALQDGRLKGSETLKAQVRLSIGEIGLDQEIDGTIALE